MAGRFLFVCSGNTCRSPMAAALARARGLAAESAGVRPAGGDGAAPLAVRALRDARGLSLAEHTPRGVAAVDLHAFDRIVALAPSVARRLRTDHGVDPDRLVTWAVPDPIGGTLADYRFCLEQIDTALDALI